MGPEPEPSRYLGKRVPSVIVVERACFVDGDALNPLRQRNMFTLKVEGGESAPWTLFIDDPGVAVECLRCDFKSTLDIAKAFLLRGTPFYTAAASPGLIAQENEHCFHGARFEKDG